SMRAARAHEEAKAAALHLVAELRPNDKVAVVAFRNRVLPFPALDPLQELDFTSDRSALENFINGLMAEGDTPLYDATVKAVKITRRQPLGMRAVVLLTDGRDERADGSPCSTLTEQDALDEASDALIPIYTIGLGKAVNSRYLQRLALRTRGSYLEAPTPDALGSLFSDILTQLRQVYVLRYTSTLSPDVVEHSVTLKAQAREGEGSASERFMVHAPETPGIRIDLEDGREVSGVMEIRPEVFARNPLDKVEVYAGGTLLGVDNSPPFSVLWNTTDPQWWASGITSHDLLIRAYDRAGHVGEYRIAGLQVRPPIPTPQPSPTPAATLVPGTPAPTAIPSTAAPPKAQPGWLWVAGGVLLAVALGTGILVLTRSKKRPVCPTCGRTMDPAWTECLFCAGAGGTVTEPAVFELASVPDTVTASYEHEEEERGAVLDKTQILRPVPRSLGWFVITDGPNKGAQFQVQHGTTLGRSPDNSIVLDDPAVSRQQAKVKLEEGEFYLYDLGATNPTLVNGQPILRHQLSDGDEVVTGNVRMVFKRILA
ncbi:MAG: FHA domain-containing protein, partial [Thermodesulfobacteriota bacterium]